MVQKQPIPGAKQILSEWEHSLQVSLHHSLSVDIDFKTLGPFKSEFPFGFLFFPPAMPARTRGSSVSRSFGDPWISPGDPGTALLRHHENRHRAGASPWLRFWSFGDIGDLTTTEGGKTSSVYASSFFCVYIYILYIIFFGRGGSFPNEKTIKSLEFGKL